MPDDDANQIFCDGIWNVIIPLQTYFPLPLYINSPVFLSGRTKEKMLLQVTSVEVVQAYIDRIQEVNPLINAVIKDR